MSISYVYYTKAPNWKCYLKNITTNSISLILVLLNKNELAAGLIFTDITESILSKHMANLIIA